MQLTIQSFLGQIYQHDATLRPYEKYIVSYLQEVLQGKTSFIVDEPFIRQLHVYLEKFKEADRKQAAHEKKVEQELVRAQEERQHSIEHEQKQKKPDCHACPHTPTSFRFWGGFFIGFVLMIILGFLAFVSYKQGLLPEKTSLSLDRLFPAKVAMQEVPAITVLDTNTISWSGATYSLSGFITSSAEKSTFDMLSFMIQDADFAYGSLVSLYPLSTDAVAPCLGSYIGSVSIGLHPTMPVFHQTGDTLSWSSYPLVTDVNTLVSYAGLVANCEDWGTGTYVLDTPIYSYVSLTRTGELYFVPIVYFVVREDGTMNSVGTLPIVPLSGYYK